MVPVLASIPSPSSGEIGPFHVYGLLVAIAVLVAARITESRWVARGGDRKQFSDLGFWLVIWGVIGARTYHLFTGYDWDRDGIGQAIAIWQGGLSIWGALGGGLVAVVVLARRRKFDALMLLDSLAPAVAVAQAIGRWGNYFNQELYGRPTSLPWGLEIDPAHRPFEMISDTTFHPTFLYESLWCLVIVAVIIGTERRFGFRRGQTLWLYLALYTFGRFWFEMLRVDPASEIFGGIRFNGVLSAVLCIIGSVAYWRGRRRVEDVRSAEPRSAS